MEEEEEEEEEEESLFKRRRKGEKERLQRDGGRGRRERGATRLMDKENVREYERV